MIVSLLDSVYLVETTICVVSEKSMIDRRTDRFTIFVISLQAIAQASEMRKGIQRSTNFVICEFAFQVKKMILNKCS